MEERRLFGRIKIKIPLKFLDPSNGKEGTAETVDISANGIGFLTEKDLPPETPLEMWLEIPDQHEPLHILGKVVWSSDSHDNTSKRVGVHLGKERLIGLGRVWLYKDSSHDK